MVVLLLVSGSCLKMIASPAGVVLLGRLGGSAIVVAVDDEEWCGCDPW